MTESRDLKGKELAWIQSSRGTLSSVVQPLGWWFEILPARLSWMRAATGSVVPNPNLNIIGYSQRERMCWELRKDTPKGGSERSADSENWVAQAILCNFQSWCGWERNKHICTFHMPQIHNMFYDIFITEYHIPVRLMRPTIFCACDLQRCDEERRPFVFDELAKSRA